VIVKNCIETPENVGTVCENNGITDAVLQNFFPVFSAPPCEILFSSPCLRASVVKYMRSAEISCLAKISPFQIGNSSIFPGLFVKIAISL